METGAAPLVTVGIPVYNGAKYLEGVFASLDAFTYPNLEFVFSDNCSTDSSAELCRRYSQGEARARVISQERNIGPIANFQYLLEEARGKYFLWYAVDDGADPEMVEELVAVLEANPGYSAAGSDVRVVDHFDNTIRIDKISSIRPEKVKSNWPKVRLGFFEYYIDNRYLLIYGLFRKSHAQQCRTDCFGKLDRLASSEIPFLAHLSCLGPIVAIERTLKIYKINPESLYHSFIKEKLPLAYWSCHFLNIWHCLWFILIKSDVSVLTKIRIGAHLVAGFPLYMARVLRRDVSAAFLRVSPARTTSFADV